MIVAPYTLHFLNLARNKVEEDGWSPVSAHVWPLLKDVPQELLERSPDVATGGGRCRLTHDGEIILKFSKELKGEVK